MQRIDWAILCLAALLVGVAVFWFTEVEPGSVSNKMESYTRTAWGGVVDEDKNCRDTRQEVLIRDSRVPVLWRDERKCEGAWGAWVDVYSGESVNDPHAMDIDHVVSLKEIHEAGGWRWETARRVRAANWMFNLLAVSAKENRAKGARGLHEWLPPRQEFHCRYVEVRATVRFVLRLPPSSVPEADVARRVLDSCAPVLPVSAKATETNTPPAFVGP